MLTGTLWTLWCCLMLVMLLWVSSPFFVTLCILISMSFSLHMVRGMGGCLPTRLQSWARPGSWVDVYTAFHAQLVTRISMMSSMRVHSAFLLIYSSFCVSNWLSCFQLCVLSPTDCLAFSFVSCLRLIVMLSDFVSCLQLLSCFQLCVLSPADCLAFSFSHVQYGLYGLYELIGLHHY